MCRLKKSTVPDKALIYMILMSRIEIGILYRAGHKLVKVRLLSVRRMMIAHGGVQVIGGSTEVASNGSEA